MRHCLHAPSGARCGYVLATVVMVFATAAVPASAQRAPVPTEGKTPATPEVRLEDELISEARSGLKAQELAEALSGYLSLAFPRNWGQRYTIALQVTLLDPKNGIVRQRRSSSMTLGAGSDFRPGGTLPLSEPLSKNAVEELFLGVLPPGPLFVGVRGVAMTDPDPRRISWSDYRDATHAVAFSVRDDESGAESRWLVMFLAIRS